MTEQQIIDEIFSIRAVNNVPWKRLMQIALKYAPEETKAVLREINTNDRAVSALLGELGADPMSTRVTEWPRA